MGRVRESTENTSLPSSCHTPSNFFFGNKSLLSFTPKPSTLVLYQCLHTKKNLLTPSYLPCLQVYNLEVLRLPLLLSCVSSLCPKLFTLTLMKGVNKLNLLHGDKLLFSFLFRALDLPSVFCLAETFPDSRFSKYSTWWQN